MGRSLWFFMGVSGVAFCGVGRAQAAPPVRAPAAAPSQSPPATAPTPAPLPPAPLPPPPPPPPPSGPPPVASSAAAAPAPAPSPAAPSPQPYPYPQPYYYYYPPPPQLRPRLPDGAAVASSPFVDATVASVSWENRLSQFLNVGAQAGVYIAGRLRLTARIAIPTTRLSDDYYNGYYGGSSTDFYVPQRSKDASLFYGFTAGIVAVGSSTFVMAPGIAFARTDVSDYGSSLALSMPFEWVTSSALRVGLELDIGRAFGGRSASLCQSNNGFGGAAACSGGPLLTADRPSGTAIWLQFQLGFGFNHPAPLPAEAGPYPAPYGLPAPSPPPPSSGLAAPPAPPAGAAPVAPAAPAAPPSEAPH